MTKKALSAEVEAWLQATGERYPNFDTNQLEQACRNATEIDPSKVSIGLAIADELLPLGTREESLLTAILYPSFHAQQHVQQFIIDQHGEAIWHLLVATQRMSLMDEWTQLNNSEFATSHHHHENLRKMLLAMIDDVRIVLIKLAERLATLKHNKNATDKIKHAMAAQILHLYAPLANRLGIGQLKWQLEDFAFRYLEPERYKQISSELKLRRVEREAYIIKMKSLLNDLLLKADISEAQVSGRPKHIYSIYKKTQRKNLPVSEIYDTSALRILVPNISDCYRLLSLVHNEWQPIPSEFDDYIANPKPNGYQSIHTAVIGPGKQNIEIQIRTLKMHDDAELGVAAHWQYKEGSDQQQQIGQKINWLRELLEWQQEVSNESKDTSISDLFTDRIYVFTPNGDALDLASGATALDFAYQVHTEIGHRCRGAKVNGKIVPLTQPLQTGDHVEILTGKNASPSRDWIRNDSPYLKTAAAKAKVRHWFKRQFYAAHLESGQLLWEKFCAQQHYPKNALNEIYPQFNFKSVKDLLAALGAGDISSQAISQRLKPLYESSPNVIPTSIVASHIKPKHRTSFIIAGVDDVLTQLARCCSPIPGDDIVGYITQGRGITIHKAACHNIDNAKLKKPERLVDAQWPTHSDNYYPVSLQIEAQDRSGLLRDISSIIANENASILSAKSQLNRIDNIALITFTLQTQGKEQLAKIQQKIHQIPGVDKVRRG